MKDYAALIALWLTDWVDDHVLKHRLYPTLCEFVLYGILHYEIKMGAKRIHPLFHSWREKGKVTQCSVCNLVQFPVK